MKLAFLPLKEATSLIRKGELEIVELYQAHLEQINRYNEKVNALRFVNRKNALAQARKRQKELASGRVGRLHGTFFSAKDNIDIQGLPRSEGAGWTAVKKAPGSARLTEILMAEGAICIGKANMAEFGRAYDTHNPHFGRTANPYNFSHSPGGSSGGDAAAVAAGFCSFGVASDAGGSIRVPASFCGLYGLYPTQGLISNSGLTSYSHSILKLFRNSGPLARTLDDLELLFEVLCRFDHRDPISCPRPLEKSIAEDDFHGRFLYFSSIDDLSCQSDIKRALKKVVKSLSSCGFQGEEKCPQEFSRAYQPFLLLAGACSFLVQESLAKRRGIIIDRKKESLSTRHLRERLKDELEPLSAESVLLAWHDVDSLRISVAKLFEKYDFLVCPVSATLAPHKEQERFTIAGRIWQREDTFRFSGLANVLGLPAISFPTGVSKDGLPVGLQIIGPRFSEKKLFKVLRDSSFSAPLDCPLK
jgi:amidase